MIYLVIVEDRHNDVMVYPFTSRLRAIEQARLTATARCRRSRDYSEKEVEDWLFYATYTVEGDSVRVVEAELDIELW